MSTFHMARALLREIMLYVEIDIEMLLKWIFVTSIRLFFVVFTHLCHFLIWPIHVLFTLIISFCKTLFENNNNSVDKVLGEGFTKRKCEEIWLSSSSSPAGDGDILAHNLYTSVHFKIMNDRLLYSTDKGTKECWARRGRAGRGLGRTRQGSQSVTADAMRLIAAFECMWGAFSSVIFVVLGV
jgi:hypothetical protein